MAFTRLRQFLRELRRRRVYRVALVYAVVAWILLQLGSTVVEPLRLPEWTMPLLIVLVVLGFVLALILTWAFEITPKGIRRTQPAPTDLEESHGAPELGRRRAAAYLGAGILIALAGFGFYAYYRGSPAPPVPDRAEVAPDTLRQITLSQITFVAEVDEYPAWSPDGRQIAFSREVEGYWNIFIKNIDTGAERQVTNTSADDIQPAWSPDGASLLFVRASRPHGKIGLSDIYSAHSFGDIWELDLESLHARNFIEDAYNPAFSPDGQWIAVDASWAGPRRLWVVDARGRNPRQVSTDTSEAFAHISPVWSSDGTRIVFQHIEGTTRDIRIIDLGTEEIAWVTNDNFTNIEPGWSARGNRIYFSSNRGGGMNIWRVKVGDDAALPGQFEQVTTGAGYDLHASVSPGGDRLAFTVLGINSNLWMLPVLPDSGLPAGDPQALVETTREDSRGAWSPDGRAIAFSSDRAGNMNIWLYSFEDDTYRQLTRGAGGDYQPNWSPDGKWVAFFSSRAGNLDIWKVDVDLGALKQLTDRPASDINPFYSPDGNYIAFHSDEGGRLEPWVIRSDGSDAKRLASMYSGIHFMRWQRDGRNVVFRAPEASPSGLWLARLSGDEPGFFVEPVGGAHISFSPDYTKIVDVADHKALWVTPLDGSEPYKVYEFEDPEVRIDYPVWSPDGRFILFDRSRPAGGNIWLAEGL